MRKVNKNFNVIPSTLTSNNCKKKIKKSLLEKGKHKFSSNYYASSTIKAKLSIIYNNKCAFCENDTTAGASLQVEHFRPKAYVADDENHPGYYWLGYEWSNLLYACSKCNRSKGNFFPIKKSGIRVFKPHYISTHSLDNGKCKSYFKDYLNEKPLIINPELQSSRDHFTFLPTGKIKGNTEEGVITIKTCKLYRKPLTIARKKMISDVLYELKKVMYDFRKNETNLDVVNYVLRNEILKLLKTYNNNDSFSELARASLLNFEYFFIRRFSNQYDRRILTRYLNEIKLSSDI